MYSRHELFLCSLECYFCNYFRRCFATREINTKITLSWALKQFVTRRHTLFSVYLGLDVFTFTDLSLNGLDDEGSRCQPFVNDILVIVFWLKTRTGSGYGLVPKGHQIITLTRWGRVTHICVDKLTIIGSDNGLSPGRRQAIIWTNAWILLIRTLATNFSEILGKIHSFSLKKMHLKMSSAKGRLFSLGLNELISDTLWHHIVTRSLSFSISEMIYCYILINVTDIFGNKWKIWLRIRPQVTILDQESITILMFQSRKL